MVVNGYNGITNYRNKSTKIGAVRGPHLVQMLALNGGEFLVGGFSPTHLKHMCKSNWIISPGFRGEHKNIFELPPLNGLMVNLP